MPSHINKWGLLLAFAVMLWSILGHIVWSGARQIHYAAQRQLKQEANKYRDTLYLLPTDLQNNPELVWVKKDEIRYKGKMYDIKDRYEQDGKIVFAGHYDEKDDRLFRILTKAFGETEQDKDRHVHPPWMPLALVQEAYRHALLPLFASNEALLLKNTRCIPLHHPDVALRPPAGLQCQ